MKSKLSIMLAAKRNEKRLTKKRTAELMGVTSMYYARFENAYGHFPRPSGPRSPAKQGHIKRSVLRLAEQRFFHPANHCC